MSASFLILVGLLAQGVVVANTATKDQAQALLAEGSERFDAGDLQGALDKFNAAYAVYPNPKILFNIGQAQQDLGRPVEALAAFEAFLAGVSDADPGVIADAHLALAALRAQLGRLRIVCSQPGADILVDGKAVGRTPITGLLWTTLGKHEITAIYPGVKPVVGIVTVPKGGVAIVPIDLPIDLDSPAKATAIEQEKTVAVDRMPSLSKAGPTDGGGWWLGRKWTWLAAGSSVVFAATAIGFGVAMQSRYDNLRQTCGSASGPDWSGCADSDLRELDDRKMLANVFWAATAVAAAGTGVLFFVEGRQVAVLPVVGTTSGLRISARF